MHDSEKTDPFEKHQAIFEKHLADLDREDLDYYSDLNDLTAHRETAVEKDVSKNEPELDRILGFSIRARKASLKASLDTRMVLASLREIDACQLEQLRILRFVRGLLVLVCGVLVGIAVTQAY